MKKLTSLILSFFLLTVSATGALADDTDTLYQSAEIERAFLVLSDDKGTAEIRFKITNQSSGRLTIIGVAGPHQIQSRILAQLDNQRFAELRSISLEPEETLDLTTSHMSIRLSGLPNSFQNPEKIDLRIILSEGELPFTAHIVNGS